MYNEDELLMLSALQHFLFCKRQCALIHIEQQWQENVFTVKGQNMHENADKIHAVKNKQVRTEYGLRIRSLELGLIGKADVVEFHKIDNNWIPYPVEYKLGKPKLNQCDEVQLCAQAICLEETIGIPIKSGALFYGKIRKRNAVSFDEILRNLTRKISKEFHELFDTGNTPPPQYILKKCSHCSLYQLCMPKLPKININNYMNGIYDEETS